MYLYEILKCASERLFACQSDRVHKDTQQFSLPLPLLLFIEFFLLFVFAIVVCTTHKHMSEAVIRSHTHPHMDCIHAQQQQALPKQKKRTHTHRHGTDDERTCTLIHILVAPQQQCKPLFSAHSASGIDFASLRAYTQMSLCVRALLAYSNAVYCPIVLQPNYFLWCTFC